MARPIALLEHGTALGDVTNYVLTPVKSGQKRTRGLIGPGQCGFRGCEGERVGGVWKDGGSYMCDRHRILLLPLRIRPREGLDQRERNERLREQEEASASDG